MQKISDVTLREGKDAHFTRNNSMIIDTADRLKTTKEYYFSVKLQEIASLVKGGKDIINMAIGSPDMPPSEATIKVLQEQASVPGNHGYQSYRSIPQLRKAISRWYEKTYHVSLNSEHEILPLIGSKEGITHISLAFLNPGDEVLVPELGYPSYRAVSQMIGGKTIDFPMLEHDHWRPDLDALTKMDLSKVKIMWINYPNMPTGAKANMKTFEELVAFAKEYKILLCHDNPYSLILNTEPPISLLSVDGAKEVAIELNSMSKSHNMAGWRIGWIGGRKDYLDNIIKIKSNVDSGMFKPLQLAAVEAFNNSDEWHEARNDEYRKRRKLVCEVMDMLDCTYDPEQTGMFIWAKLPDYIKSAEVFVDHLLYNYDVFISPGFIFGKKGDRYIRGSLCIEQDVVKQVISRIKGIDLKNI